MPVPRPIKCPFCEKAVEEMRSINTGGLSRVTLWVHVDGEMHWAVDAPRDGVTIARTDETK